MARSLRLAFEGDMFVLEEPWCVTASWDLGNRLNVEPKTAVHLPPGTAVKVVRISGPERIGLRATVGKFKPLFYADQKTLEKAVFKD